MLLRNLKKFILEVDLKFKRSCIRFLTILVFPTNVGCVFYFKSQKSEKTITPKVGGGYAISPAVALSLFLSFPPTIFLFFSRILLSRMLLSFIYTFIGIRCGILFFSG